jgi:hypothetical protein
MLTTDNIIELDERVNTTGDNGIDARLSVPTHYNVLNEYYMSFDTDGKHLLEVTQKKYDEDQLFTGDSADFLLYLPKRNEQIFANEITNIHPIADNVLSVFTEHSIWNITTATLEDGTVVYSAPILSKIPVGCRDRDDIMTALDGQAVLMATSRGIAALTPQDFVATADNVLTYLSDSIQDIYYKFYTTSVSDAFGKTYSPSVKMLSYRYWLLFYKYLDRTILVCDTRNGSWWRWTTPYPIKQLVSDTHLYLIMQIDKTKSQSYGGVSYVWRDHEDTNSDTIFVDDSFIVDILQSGKGYRDDIIDGTLNGSVTEVYENEFVGTRSVVEYASPIINWSFTSQKLHFNQINNFKAVKGVTAILEGDDVVHAAFTAKIYRNFYHPEQNDIMRVPVNELRTFTHRLNLLHVINFQYKFENYANVDEETPLRLSSLTIKYEVKEGVR